MADDGVDGAFGPGDPYVRRCDGGLDEAVPIAERSWPDVMTGRQALDGRLVTAGEVAQDWDRWEMHPDGEELLVLLSGAVDMIVEQNGAERRVVLHPGEAFLVPRGAWHRAEVREPGRMLFVARGENPARRPV